MIDRSKISTQSFKRKIGTGSKRPEFEGEFLMIFSNLVLRDPSLKRDRLAGVRMAGMTVVEEAVTMIF